jgi:hypothetical protein
MCVRKCTCARDRLVNIFRLEGDNHASYFRDVNLATSLILQLRRMPREILETQTAVHYLNGQSAATRIPLIGSGVPSKPGVMSESVNCSETSILHCKKKETTYSYSHSPYLSTTRYDIWQCSTAVSTVPVFPRALRASVRGDDPIETKRTERGYAKTTA